MIKNAYEMIPASIIISDGKQMQLYVRILVLPRVLHELIN